MYCSQKGVRSRPCFGCSTNDFSRIGAYDVSFRSTQSSTHDCTMIHYIGAKPVSLRRFMHHIHAALSRLLGPARLRPEMGFPGSPSSPIELLSMALNVMTEFIDDCVHAAKRQFMVAWIASVTYGCTANMYCECMTEATLTRHQQYQPVNHWLYFTRAVRCNDAGSTSEDARRRSTSPKSALACLRAPVASPCRLRRSTALPTHRQTPTRANALSQ